MELPDELMTLILLKLPVKTLGRIKCVQKSWYSLINSPQFIHLHKKKKNDCFIARRFHGERQQEENVLSLHSYEILDDLDNEINIPALSNKQAWLCGSCDGLVCLANQEKQIFLCNPSIRESRSLVFPPSLSVRSGFHIDSVAFGSDPNTGQYAVVMIGMPKDCDRIHNTKYGDREVWLYDFSTDSWREITVVAFPPGTFRYSLCAVSLNGVFHWCPWDHDSNNIITFQISNEVTGNIPLPDFFDLDVFSNKHLCVSSESQLSLVLYDYWKGRLEIWAMTEYGVKESWTRLFKIGMPLQLHFLQPIVFWDEQRLLLRNEARQLVSCDLQHHQNLCHFPIHGDFDLSPYSQSLVSVNGIGHPVL